MRKRLLILLVGGCVCANSFAAPSCLDTDALIALDARYEMAVQTGDTDFLQRLLAPEYSWVHNLTSMKENKTALIVRLQKPDAQVKERRSHDIRALRLANTVVLEGLSSVDKWNADGKTYRTSRYQFMRTYVAVKGECKLLAVQTMKVWSSDGK